ncbi:hypothetical protein HDU76_011185, partial [Blyttiomyces sp. JEL0837]
HHNKEHTEATAQEFQAQVQPGWETHPEYVANYLTPGGKHHGKHHHHHQAQ